MLIAILGLQQEIRQKSGMRILRVPVSGAQKRKYERVPGQVNKVYAARTYFSC
jgi:hypothetical protein